MKTSVTATTQLPSRVLAGCASPKNSRFLAAATRAVFVKDWRGEWRTRAALNAIALFSVAAPVAFSFSVARQKLEPEVLGGALWTVLLFAALVGLARAFVREEENGTAVLLRLNCAADAVLWGKACFNLALLLLTQSAAVPIFVLLLNAKIESVSTLLFALFLGDIGLATVSTLLGAMAAQARARGALFSAIAVPLLLPLLAMATSASSIGFGAAGSAIPALQMMLAYDIAMIAAAWLLFGFVWQA